MITRVKRLSIKDEVREDAEYMIRKFRENHPTFRTRMFGTEHCRVFIVSNRLRAIKIDLLSTRHNT